MASGKEAVLVGSTVAEMEIDESSLAWKIFAAFVSDSQIEASEEELIDFAVKILSLDKSKLSSDMLENLPLIVVAYMNLWSGWHFKNEFLAGKFKREHYFNRFNKYLAHRLRIVINTFEKNGMKAIVDVVDYKYKSAVKSTGKPTGSGASSVIDVKGPVAEFSPFAISIQCPAHMVNTIVFSNSGDDVIMKQHLGSQWTELTTTQLMNWPHIEVTFRTEDLCFVRKQATEFIRYLNFLPHDCKKSSDNIIEHAEALPAARADRQSYTYRLIEAYVKEYLLALKTVKQMSEAKFEEIQTVLYQFLEDIRYINVNKSMATKTLILFRLSLVPFIRNKKLVKGSDKVSDEARVGYCEIITPKIELVMLYFSATQSNNGNYSRFDLVNRIRAMALTQPDFDINSVLPYISYKCTFCNVEFKSSNAQQFMIDHLKREHKMEQHVRCTVCKKQFDVMNLTACRWRHKCMPTANTTLKVTTIVE